MFTLFGNFGSSANEIDLTRQEKTGEAGYTNQTIQSLLPPPDVPSSRLPPPQHAGAAPLHPLLMAAYPVDPTPFLPGRYTAVEVAGRPPICRYHVSSPVPAMHEDVAIATITPPPNGSVPFAQVRAFLRSFIEDHQQFTLDMIQKCPLGQAYVQLDSSADRDWLVDHSPFAF